MDSRYIDIHILQTLPPSNANRDDVGSPKSARFGGHRRARISSQAWKRAARVAFDLTLEESLRSTRTRRVIDLLVSHLIGAGLREEEAASVAKAALQGLGLRTKSSTEATSQYLLFLGEQQIRDLVDRLLGSRDQLLALLAKEEELVKLVERLRLQEVLAGPQPAAVALFGRMVADLPALNVDAAVQVAHAISTHPVELEFDYFTAVDDLNPEDATGAGMIGTVEFNAATYYRWATVNTGLLAENLGGEAGVAPVVEAFLRAWVTAVPSGHITTFGHHTLPELVIVAVRDHQPVNLVSTFEAPVWETQNGIAVESARRLCRALQDVADTYSLRPELVVLTAMGAVRDVLMNEVLSQTPLLEGACASFEEMVGRVVRHPAMAEASA